jgi:hypothetical protein
MNGSIGPEYTALCIDVPADVEAEIDAWLDTGMGQDGMITDWGDFMAAAWAVLPHIWSAYQIYKEWWKEDGPISAENGRMMNLGEFAEYSVYEWFK